ncbi:glycine--tRNA ligase subunit alpha, partial [Mesorhizobium sp.]
AGAPASNDNSSMHRLVFPAYDQCIKASHVFNLLDARGVISVTERQSYILRVRNLAKACGEAFLQTRAGGLAT